MLEEILKKYFSCVVPFRNDGTLTKIGVEAYKRLENLLHDLEEMGVIYDASESIRKLDAIVDEGLDEPVLANIKKMLEPKTDMDIELKHEIELEHCDGIKYTAKCVGTLDYGYLSGTDVVLLTLNWPENGEDFLGDIYYASDLTPNSLRRLYEEVKITVAELADKE